MKKSLLRMSGVITVGLLISGCVTNIASLPITARDNEKADNPYLQEYQDYLGSRDAMKIIIVPDVPAKDQETKQLQALLERRLDNMFSNLNDFQVVPRSETAAMINEVNLQNITSEEEKQLSSHKVEDMLIYKIDNLKYGQTSKSVYNSQTQKSSEVPYYGGYASISITLLNLKTQEKTFTESVTGQSGKESDSKNINLLELAVEDAVKNFATQYAIKYAPPALVIQTKGSGQVAMINIGKNNGLMINQKVEFFNYKIVNGQKKPIPFAYGKIIELADDTAWVKVDDFEKANVKENCFAKVRTDQSKSFLDNFDN